MFNCRINSVNRVYYASCVLVLLFTSSLFGQVSLDIQKINTSTLHHGKKAKLISSELYNITTEQLLSALSAKELNLTLDHESLLQLKLTETKGLASTHKAIIYTPVQKSISSGFNKQDIKVFSGTVNDRPSSQANITVTAKGMQGTIFDGEDFYYLEKSLTNNPETSIELMLYKEQDIHDKTIRCLVNEKNTRQLETVKQTKSTNPSCIYISMAVAVDYYYYQLYNYDVAEVIARTLTVMNAAALDYTTEFQDSIKFSIVEHFISTCDSCDPWGDNRDALVLIENFSHWAEEDGFSQPFNLGQLWTGGDLQRDQSSSTIGYAFKGGLCSNKRYHVLEDYSESLWKLRLLASHEIGHNLNCSHDPVGSNTIMSPSISNTSEWSENSISTINSFVSNLNCIQSCSIVNCDPISGFVISNYTPQTISASWSSTESVSIKLVDENTNGILFETMTVDNAIHIPGEFSNCETLRLELSKYCGTELSKTSILLGSPHLLSMDILDYKPINCVPGSAPSYDIQLIINHNGIEGEQFFADIEGQTSSFFFTASPQTIVIDRAHIQHPSISKTVQLFSIVDSEIYCLSEATLDNVPNRFCDLYVVEDFNDCSLPYDWSISSSNTTYFPFAFSWQFNDNTRKILNYGKADNAAAEKTISGNCMAYFDDDINSNTNFTGNTVLYTENFDISDYENVQLSFAYLFHSFEDVKGSNNSYFSIQIWSNNTWIEVLRDDMSQCPWSDVWKSECMDFFNINIDPLNEQELKCRFIFSDSNEGDWTGMIALDNFILEGQRILNHGCTDPESINFDPHSDFDDGSCYSCHNFVQDGNETGIDCGGDDCEPCTIPCATSEQTITNITTDSTYSNIDLINVAATIDELNIILNPGKSAVFISGFEISSGSTLSASITPCFEDD